MMDFLAAPHPAFVRLGWALVHLLWQGLLVTAALEIALGLAGARNSRMRYALCGAALAALPVCFAVTFWQISQTSAAPVPPASAASTGAAFSTAALSGSTGEQPSPDVATSVASMSLPIFTTDWNRFMPLLASVWLAGVILLSGRKTGGMVLLGRWRRRGIAEPDETMKELFRRACQKIGIDPRRVCLKISTVVRVPMTMGWWRPIVLFPACLLSGLGPDEIELLLAHELAHIRRCDYAVNLLQTVVETLFFYHPLTWWISRRVRQERENCCDDLVARGRVEALAYAKALLRLETMCSPAPELVTAANGGSLLERVERLVGEPRARVENGAVAILVLVALFAGVAALAQNAAPEKLPAAMTATEAKQKGIAALVNGTPIYWSDLPFFGNSPEPYLKSKFSGDVLKQKLEEARFAECESGINRELAIQDALASGYRVSPKDLEARVDFGVKGFGGSKEAFVRNLEKNGLSLEKFNERNRDDMLFSHAWELRVYEPAIKNVYGSDAAAAAVQADAAKQKLFTAESTRLDNAWMAELQAKAVVQRFAELKRLAPSLTAKEAKEKGIAAMVNGHAITKVEVQQQMAVTEKSLRTNSSGKELQERLLDARRKVLVALTNRRLIIDDFHKQGEFIPPSYIDERINEIVSDQYGGDRGKFLQTLADRGTDEEACRKEIDENAIVSYARTKFVVDKASEYYQAHLDQFPQNEQVSVTVMEIKGSTPVPANHIGDFANETDPRAAEAREVLGEMKAGADVSKHVATEGIDQRVIGRPRWVTKENAYAAVPAWWPFKWDDIDKLKPGETTGVVVGDGMYSHGDLPEQNYHYYWILRVNERRPAKVPPTPEMANQEKAVMDAKANQIQEAWLGSLRTQASIQVFDPALVVSPGAPVTGGGSLRLRRRRMTVAKKSP